MLIKFISAKDNIKTKTMFVWIVLSSFVSGGAYSVCAPILPPELERKDISGLLIGIIFAMYSVGSIFWAPLVGKYLI